MVRVERQDANGRDWGAILHVNLMASADLFGNLSSVSCKTIVVLEDSFTALMDFRSILHDGSMIRIDHVADFVQSSIVTTNTRLNLLDRSSILSDDSSVTLGRWVMRCIDQSRVLSNQTSIEVLDLFICFHNSTINSDLLSIHYSHIVRNGKHCGIKLASVVELGQTSLVHHCFTEVDLHISGSWESLQQGKTVTEDLIRIVIGQLAVAQEGSRSVGQNEIRILSDSASQKI